MSFYDSGLVAHVIGVMSGTSLDGLDLAACSFTRNSGKWRFSIEAVRTVEYSSEWRQSLGTAHHLNAVDLLQLHFRFGRYVADCVNMFISDYNLTKEQYAVASHGHTVFHQPENGLTCQIGSGLHISLVTGMICINDFRTADVAMGGQGAPLVPAGDELLFDEYNACLNIGGFSNCSFRKNRGRIAFDICPANIVLNALTEKIGKSFDENGCMAATGMVRSDLLETLNAHGYFKLLPPKSLGREWVDEFVMPLLIKSKYEIADLLRTYVEHIAIQICQSLAGYNNILVTGGGAHNSFLMNRMQHLSGSAFVVPDSSLVDFKEAIVFAFLGLLRLRGQDNVLASVTGAPRNHCSGLVHLPPIFSTNLRE